VTRARRTGLVAWTIALLVCAPAGRTSQAAQETPERYIEPHLVTPGERELRQLLTVYAEGRTGDAVRGLLAHAPQWTTDAIDEMLARIDADIRFHRRPQNRVSVTADQRLEQRLRADRIQVLRLAAALQLEASVAATDLDQIGYRILAAEHAVRALERLRADLDKAGTVPSPVPVGTLPEQGPEPAEARVGFDTAAMNTFVRRWYAAAVARMQDLVEVTLGPALTDRGLERFPNDPDLLVARGSYAESRVALERVDVSLASVLYSSDERRRFRNELDRAATDHERARRTSGDASEATVRLARLRLLDGDAAGARALLDRALTPELPARLRVLALMVRAAAAEALGHLDDAVTDYTEAQRLDPDAQTPAVALSHLAVVRNQRADALSWAERALTRTGTRDPWRLYLRGQGWQLDLRRSEVSQLARQ
jgi:tetratricopeptide (TPR) repeat protein